MAKRFYQPSSSKYISQFVPDELPADLMLKATALKQGKYDTQLAKNEALNDLEINALKGYDTKYRDEYKQRIRDFVDQSYGEDLGSPDFQSRYLNFVRKYKDDEGLKKIKQAYETHQDMLKRKEELVKKGADAAADEVFNDYNRRFALYTDEKGQGFQGDVSLGDPNIIEGVNRFKEGLEFFTPLKESGSENVAFLNSGISYKNGWEGISDSRVKKQVENVYNDWETSSGGRQTSKLYDMQRGVGDYEISKLDPEAKKKYIDEKNKWMKNEFLQIGRTVVHGKSTTNRDEALNKEEERGYKEMKEAETSPILTGKMEGVLVKDVNLNYDQQLYKLDNTYKDLREQLNAVKDDPSQYAQQRANNIRAALKDIESQKASVNKQKDIRYKELYDKVKSQYPDKAKEKMSPQAQKLLSSLVSEHAFKIDENGKPVIIQGKNGYNGFYDQKRWLEFNENFNKLSDKDKWLLKGTAGLKSQVDKAWREDQHPKNSPNDIEYTGYTTLPKGKNSTALVEQQQVNLTPDAYKYYVKNPETGKLQEVNYQTLRLNNFQVEGITNNNFINNKRGLVGKMDMTVNLQTDPEKMPSEKVRQLQVIAVSKDPNSQLSNYSHGKDYLKQARILKTQGNFESSKQAERTAMSLFNPMLADEFDRVEKSDNVQGKIVPVSLQTEGTVSSGANANVRINKLKDGSYDLHIDNKDGSPITTPQNFKDIESAKEYMLQIAY